MTYEGFTNTYLHIVYRYIKTMFRKYKMVINLDALLIYTQGHARVARRPTNICIHEHTHKHIVCVLYKTL